MSKYSELIKRFDKIRDYVRDFYIYGFKSREDFNKKSFRSYDNERRRIEGYLSDIMFFKTDDTSKNIFISTDTREVLENPLYRTFKTKSFTKNDISLHFILLDILEKKEELNVIEISNIIFDEYLSMFQESIEIDISTIRKKLKEYEKYGLLVSKKEGRELLYSKAVKNIQIDDLKFAIMYFSEVSPLGIIGSYILDKTNEHNLYFFQKHNYLFYSLESEVLYNISKGIMDKRCIEVERFIRDKKELVKEIVIPLKFLVNSLGGRRYVACYDHKLKRFKNIRLDKIKDIKILDKNEEFEKLKLQLEKILHNTWGVSYGSHQKLERIEILFEINSKEGYIKDRILREGEKGVLTHLYDDIYRYEIELFEPREMLPWIRTFTGRVLSLKSTNKLIEKLFYSDLKKLCNHYLKEESNDI